MWFASAMPEPLFHMNYSRWRAWVTCRRQYWYSYVSKEPWPEDTQSPAGLIGKAVHEGMKFLADTDDEEVGAQRMDAYLRMPSHDTVAPGTESYRLAFEYYKRGISAHRSLESLDRRTEVDSWRHFKDFGVRLQSRMDRVDKMANDHYVVIDWKTSKYMPDQQTDMQLDIAHTIMRVTRPQLGSGGLVDSIAWNLRTGEKRVRRLTIQDAVMTGRLMGRLASRIQQETEFEAAPGSHCLICQWRPKCEEAEFAVSGALPPEFDEDDPLQPDPEIWADS